MKLQGIGAAVWLTWILTASAQTVLPEAAPGSFAPVPAKITAGPLLPAEPMEATALAFGDCSNAGALLKNLRIQLSEEQIKLFDAQRFLLIPIEATALAEALQRNFQTFPTLDHPCIPFEIKVFWSLCGGLEVSPA